MELKQKVNREYKDLFTKRFRYVILMGGRGAGRSTVASQYALTRLVAPEYFRCAIMRYVLGDIRKSIYREIVDRAEESEILDRLEVNDGLMFIKHGANTINAVGFKKSSGAQKAKLKSLANYNCVEIEEADEVAEADFMQLDDSLRTLKGDITIILCLNCPPKSHWIIKRFFDLEPVEGLKDFYLPVLKPELQDEVLFIRTSYLDNMANIDPQTATRYERYKETNTEYYWNMIAGYVPEVVRGKIFSNWQEIEKVPHEARLVRRGLDFGYTNDPTTAIDIYEYNGGYILDEVLWQKGMSNKQIADTLSILPQILTIADSAEPKSIDEIRAYGLNILPAVKGTDSINNGIQIMKSIPISYTKRSVHLAEEYHNYSWLVDKEGVTVNTPKPGYDHCIDAARYAVMSLKIAANSSPSVLELPQEQEVFPDIWS